MFSRSRRRLTVGDKVAVDMDFARWLLIDMGLTREVDGVDTFLKGVRMQGI